MLSESLNITVNVTTITSEINFIVAWWFIFCLFVFYGSRIAQEVLELRLAVLGICDA